MGLFCVGRCFPCGEMQLHVGLEALVPLLGDPAELPDLSCFPGKSLQRPKEHPWDDAEQNGTPDSFPFRLQKTPTAKFWHAPWGWGVGGVSRHRYLGSARPWQLPWMSSVQSESQCIQDQTPTSFFLPLAPPLPTFVRKSNRKRESLNFLNCFTHPQLEFQSEMKMPLKSTLHGSLREQVFLCCRV